MGTYLISSSAQFDVLLNDGATYRIKAGANPGCPEEVAKHWYVKANGCQIADQGAIDAAEAKAQQDAQADAFAAAKAKAEALGLKIDGRWSFERLNEEIAEAEAKAQQ